MQVPAEEAQMWTEFDKAVTSGNFQAGAEVLRRYGRNTGGVETEMISGRPNTTPLAQQ
jgi:acyl-coenzyme A thioesterase PaaI-like protein